MTSRNVLLTGAAGRIGRAILPTLRERYSLRVLDTRPVPDMPDALQGNIADLPFMCGACADIHTVVHLAANPHTKAPLEELVEPNLVGVCQVFEAAHRQGVKRVVYASSCNTHTGYDRDETVTVDAPPKVISLYGGTKVWAEMVAQTYHRNYGLQSIGLRIGAFFESPDMLKRKGKHPPRRSISRMLYLSPRDVTNAVVAAIESPKVGCDAVFVTSRTEEVYQDLSRTQQILDWEPVDELPAEIQGEQPVGDG